MKSVIKFFLDTMGYELTKKNIPSKTNVALKKIFLKYQSYSMLPENIYIDNLMLIEQASKIEGDVCECGVWKGGMIAGIAELLGKGRSYYLFDSFEGLPAAKEIDGTDALMWQKNKEGATYYNNCSAEEYYAQKAMDLTKTDYYIKKGWFNETLPLYKNNTPIAILRLDGDWYDSTFDCLKYLYPFVNNNGIIILDDYYAWEGCSRALHDYLSSINSVSRIHKTVAGTAYVIKKDKYGN